MATPGYDTELIARLPRIHHGDVHAGLIEVQGYLRRFGYLVNAQTYLDAFQALASARLALPQGLTIGRLDEQTAEALSKFQHQFGIPQTGEFDHVTRERMSMPRCAMLDSHPIAATAQGRWPRQNLTFAFGPALSAQVPTAQAQECVRAAFGTWQQVPLGFTFTEVAVSQSPDIVVEWRSSSDPDFSMVGITVAHADFPPFPPEAAQIVSAPPVPLHFDEGEKWATDAQPGAYDIQTIALHEIGHCLGLHHSMDPGSVMYAAFRQNYANRTLANSDMITARSIYT